MRTLVTMSIGWLISVAALVVGIIFIIVLEPLWVGIVVLAAAPAVLALSVAIANKQSRSIA